VKPWYPELMLVSVEWLAAHLDDPRLAVVDVRGEVLPPSSPPPRYRAKRAAYDAGHVPGAVFVDWTTDIVDQDDPVPVQVAPPRAFGEAMGQRGIRNDAKVVCYDDYSHMFAGRLAWALRYHGHDDVHVLDGGWNAWVAGGKPITAEVPRPTLVHFVARPQPALRRTADEVARALANGALVIDARSPAQYEGAASAARRAGHIPGAINVPYPTLLEGPDRGFLPRDLPRARLAAQGVDVATLSPEREVIVYCNGGVSATVPLMAMALLGRTDVAVYDGSWNEWGNDDARPLRAGKAP